MPSLLKRLERLPKDVYARWIIFKQRRRELYLTSTVKTDGAGTQALALVSIMAVAKHFGHTYLHRPFRVIEHGPAGDKEWVRRWEDFFNLGEGEVAFRDFADRRCLEIKGRHAFYLPHRATQLDTAEGRTVFAFLNCFDMTDVMPDLYLLVRDSLRAKFANSCVASEQPCDFSEEVLSIAVHLRRGDVSGEQNSERYTPNSETVADLRAFLGKLEQSAEVHIYSQGEVADFAEFRGLNVPVIFHLDECPMASFKNLTRARVLFTAKSAFSFLAGLLSDGLVIYEPFQYGPLPEWTPRNALHAANYCPPQSIYGKPLQKHTTSL